MKRLQVHVGVHDLRRSIRFYSAMFAAEPEEIGSRLAQADVSLLP